MNLSDIKIGEWYYCKHSGHEIIFKADKLIDNAVYGEPYIKDNMYITKSYMSNPYYIADLVLASEGQIENAKKINTWP